MIRSVGSNLGVAFGALFDYIDAGSYRSLASFDHPTSLNFFSSNDSLIVVGCLSAWVDDTGNKIRYVFLRQGHDTYFLWTYATKRPFTCFCASVI